MKKKFLSKLFTLALTFVLALNLAGINASAVNANNQYIFDDANLLTYDEYNVLNDYARQVSEYYGCAVHIFTTDDPSVNEYNIQTIAEEVYLRYSDFGWGYGKDGFMLMLSMAERDYCIIAYGDKGNYVLTDYGKDMMAEKILDNFRANDWYGGFSDYLSYARYVLEEAENGHVVDVYYYNESVDVGVEAYGFAAIIGLVFAFVVCFIYKNQMQTAVAAAHAKEYVVEDDIEMNIQQDVFKFTTTHRTRIQTNSGGGGGSRGGTTINSRGFSGRSGKF